MNDDRFLDWFAGFVAGEGCFGIVRSHPTGVAWATQLSIKLRDDDLCILINIQEQLGFGNVYRSSPRRFGTGGVACWQVRSGDACRKLVEIFDGHPLRARKQKDYEIWREAVIENQKSPKSRSPKKLQYLHDKLSLIRAYEPQEDMAFELDAIQLAFPENEE